MDRKVTVAQQGREGRVYYHEGSNSLSGYQEFGGGDVVAIVSMGSALEWHRHHAWAVDRRPEILRYIADEVIRQKAAGYVADIDETRGDILLRKAGGGAVLGAGAALASTADVSWVSRYLDLKGKFALIALVVILAVGLVFWLKTRVFVVQGGKGIPMGSTVRTDTHLATLIQQRQPYSPSLHHDPSTERFDLGVLLIPLDGSAPQLVPLIRDLRPGSYSLARVLGNQDRTLWIDANGIRAVDLRTYSALSEDELRDAGPPPEALRSGNPLWMSTPPATEYMAAGVRLSSGNWLGLHSSADLEKSYQPGRWLRAVESANDASRESRRLVLGELAPEEAMATGLRQIRSMTPIGNAEYRNASLLRMDSTSEPLRLPEPDSVLMLYSSGAESWKSTLAMARVETATGRLLWNTDTALDRLKLQQILPAQASTVFVGTRLPVPDQVSEPLIVILDHATGRLVTHSLWR